MDNIPYPRSPWIQALDRAGWNCIADRVIHGLCHDLSGRAGSLSGLTFLLDSQDGDTRSVLPFLNQEVDQLEEAVRLLRLLPDDGTGPELLAPGELMHDLQMLVRSQRGLEEVPVQVEGFSQAPALRMDPSFFVRSLVWLLTGSAERVVIQQMDGIVVKARDEDGRLCLQVWPRPEGGGEDHDPVILPVRIVSSEGLRIWKDMLREEGVAVEEIKDPGEGSGIQLVFPSPSSS